MVCITTLAVIQIKSCCTNPSDTHWSGFRSAKSEPEKNNELHERKTKHGVNEHRSFTDCKLLPGYFDSHLCLRHHFCCFSLTWLHDALWSSVHARFSSIVSNSIKRLISHESLGLRLETLLFYRAVLTYTDSILYMPPNCCSFLRWVTRTTRTARLKSKMAKTSQNLKCPSQPLPKEHSRDETSIPVKHQTYQQTYPAKNKSSSPTCRLLRLFEI